jgi:hypothetical protein
MSGGAWSSPTPELWILRDTRPGMIENRAELELCRGGADGTWAGFMRVNGGASTTYTGLSLNEARKALAAIASERWGCEVLL